MRGAIRLSLLLLCAAGCATSVVPRQYLDEDTAATITVVAKPWIFAGQGPDSAFTKRGFLNLYALNVNRAGTHQRYLAVMQSSFDVALPDEKSSTPTLEVEANGRRMIFESTQNPRQFGIARPLERPIALESRWWYFPATKEQIEAVAQAQNPRVLLASNNARFAYVEFRNGSKELTEFLVTLH